MVERKSGFSRRDFLRIFGAGVMGAWAVTLLSEGTGQEGGELELGGKSIFSRNLNESINVPLDNLYTVNQALKSVLYEFMEHRARYIVPENWKTFGTVSAVCGTDLGGCLIKILCGDKSINVHVATDGHGKSNEAPLYLLYEIIGRALLKKQIVIDKKHRQLTPRPERPVREA